MWYAFVSFWLKQMVHPWTRGAEPSYGSYGVVLRMQLMVLPIRSLKKAELFLVLIK
jgi:hypothetical protein